METKYRSHEEGVENAGRPAAGGHRRGAPRLRWYPARCGPLPAGCGSRSPAGGGPRGSNLRWAGPARGDEFESGVRAPGQRSMSSLMSSGGRSGPRATRNWIEQVPESRSRSIGPCHRPWPGVRFAVLPGARPAVQGGQAGVERDVRDPPERQPAPGRAPVGEGLEDYLQQALTIYQRVGPTAPEEHPGNPAPAPALASPTAAKSKVAHLAIEAANALRVDRREVLLAPRQNCRDVRPSG